MAFVCLVGWQLKSQKVVFFSSPTLEQSLLDCVRGQHCMCEKKVPVILPVETGQYRDIPVNARYGPYRRSGDTVELLKCGQGR